MKVIEISSSDRQKYDQFVEDHPFGTIHQLWDWGVFQSKTANRDRFWVLALENNSGAIEASALIIRQKLPFNKCWLYCPRGPLVDYTNSQNLKLLFTKISEIAYQQNAVFFRFDPPLKEDENNGLSLQKENQSYPNTFSSALSIIHANLTSLKARPAHAHYQPESTLIIDLKPSLEEILKQMKPKGRYNIKVAQKHGVIINTVESKTKTQSQQLPSNLKDSIETFCNLLRQTTTRDKFSGHPLSYYQNMFQVLGLNHTKLYLAQYQNKIIAAAIITYFKNTATYYFGASSNEYRNVMAPYLLHWQIMQDAKAEGYQWYDLFGIAPAGAKNHPWASVTEFKLKFGGKQINYLPAQEIVYQPFWYFLIKLTKRILGRT